jgi:hypothetical protein
VVLYGREIWSLIFEEEHTLWFFENKVLRRILGPKRYEVTGVWRKLFFSKYNQNDQVKEHKTGRACSTIGGQQDCI